MKRSDLPQLRRVATVALTAAAVLGTAATSLAPAAAAADVTSAVAIAPLRPVPRADGTVTFRLHVPGPGTVSIRETAWADNFAAGFGPAPAPGSRFTFASDSVAVSADGIMPVAVVPNADGRRLIAHHTFKPLVRLWVTFTPAAGTPSDIGVYGLQIPSAAVRVPDHGERVSSSYASGRRVPRNGNSSNQSRR